MPFLTGFSDIFMPIKSDDFEQAGICSLGDYS